MNLKPTSPARTPLNSKLPPSALVSAEARKRRLEEIVKGVQEGKALAAAESARLATPTPAPRNLGTTTMQVPPPPTTTVTQPQALAQPMDLDTMVLSDNSDHSTPLPPTREESQGIQNTSAPQMDAIPQPTPPPLLQTRFSFVTPLCAANMKAKDPRPRKRARELSPDQAVTTAQSQTEPQLFQATALTGLQDQNAIGTWPNAAFLQQFNPFQSQMATKAQTLNAQGVAAGQMQLGHTQLTTATPLYPRTPWNHPQTNSSLAGVLAAANGTSLTGWPHPQNAPTPSFPHHMLAQQGQPWVPYDPYTGFGNFDNSPYAQTPLYVLGQTAAQQIAPPQPSMTPRCDASTTPKGRLGMLASLGFLVTPAPEKGFKPRQMADPGDLLRAANPCRGPWEECHESKRIAVQVMEQVTPENLPLVSAKLKRDLPIVAGEHPVAILAPPKNLPTSPDFDYAPTWLIYGLSEHATRVLVEQSVWATPSLTFYVYGDQHVQALPTYIMTLTGFCHNIHNMVPEGLRRIFHSDTLIAHFAEALSDNPAGGAHALPAAKLLVDSITYVMTGTELGETRVTAAIYVNCPKTMPKEKWRALKTALRGYVYHVQGNTQAKVRPHERCRDCHGVDHNAGDCPITRTPGWLGGSTYDIYRDTRSEEFDIDGHPGSAYHPLVPPPPYPGLQHSQHAPRAHREEPTPAHTTAPGPSGGGTSYGSGIAQYDRVWRSGSGSKSFREEARRAGNDYRDERDRYDNIDERNWQNDRTMYDARNLNLRSAGGRPNDPKGKGTSYGKRSGKPPGAS
ncbi:hypothetical protein GY45DRAFT_1334547 [Cubamyces sp. BRFM 1775]|nr:hypothetical protein GY45DRAFT_1334547 [Cubamyces sp. BRFM 1775]